LTGFFWAIRVVLKIETDYFFRKKNLLKCRKMWKSRNMWKPGRWKHRKNARGKAPNLEFFIKMKPTRKPMKLNPILSPHLEILDNSSLWQRFCSLWMRKVEKIDIFLLFEQFWSEFLSWKKRVIWSESLKNKPMFWILKKMKSLHIRAWASEIFLQKMTRMVK